MTALHLFFINNKFLLSFGNSAAPTGSPTNISTVINDSRTLLLMWDPPNVDQINGVIQFYIIAIYEEESTTNFVLESNVSAMTLDNLHPFYTYAIQISAVTVSAGPPSESLVVQMPADGQ